MSIVYITVNRCTCTVFVLVHEFQQAPTNTVTAAVDSRYFIDRYLSVQCADLVYSAIAAVDKNER